MARASLADAGVLAFLDAPAWVARRHLGPLVAVMLPARLVAVIPSSLGQYLTYGVQAEENVAVVMLGLALTYSGLLFSMVVLAVGFSALAHGVEQVLRGQPVQAGLAWRQGARPAAAGTVALVGLLVVVGTAMCIVPGLLASVFLALTLPVVAAEGLVGGKALDRSVALARHGSRDRYLTSTGAWLLCMAAAYGLVNYAVGSLVTLPAAAVGAWYGVRAAAEGAPIEDLMTMLPGALAVAMNLAGAFAYVLADVWLVVAVALLHRRTRDLLEGDDLRAALGARGG